MSDQERGVHAFVAVEVGALVPVGVLAHAGQKRGSGAEAGGLDGLVRPLAPVHGPEPVPDQGLAGPGQAFRLDEDTVVGFVRDLQRADPDRWLVDVDGPYRRIGVRDGVDPIELLNAHYRGVQVEEEAR